MSRNLKHWRVLAWRQRLLCQQPPSAYALITEMPCMSHRHSLKLGQSNSSLDVQPEIRHPLRSLLPFPWIPQTLSSLAWAPSQTAVPMRSPRSTPSMPTPHLSAPGHAQMLSFCAGTRRMFHIDIPSLTVVLLWLRILGMIQELAVLC